MFRTSMYNIIPSPSPSPSPPSHYPSPSPSPSPPHTHTLTMKSSLLKCPAMFSSNITEREVTSHHRILSCITVYPYCKTMESVNHTIVEFIPKGRWTALLALTVLAIKNMFTCISMNHTHTVSGRGINSCLYECPHNSGYILPQVVPPIPKSPSHKVEGSAVKLH